METRSKILTNAVLVAFALVAPLVARADDDHDVARDLYMHGEIRALSYILSIVRAAAPGDIVAVEFSQLGDKWIYQFQVVRPDGHREMVEVDASSAMIIKAVGGGG